jgi:hypothetical protein
VDALVKTGQVFDGMHGFGNFVRGPLHLLAPLALRVVKDAGAHQAAAFARQMHQPHFGGKEPAAGVTMQPFEHGHLAGESGLQFLMRHFCRGPAIRLTRRTDIRGRQAE